MSRLGVCSWSLQPDDAGQLVERTRAAGLAAVQLHLDPLREGRWPVASTRTALADGGVEILSGMMSTRGEDYSTLETIRRTGGLRPDVHWEENLAAARANAALARDLGLGLVSFHAGFLPHDPSDPEREVLLDRLRTTADAFAAEGVAVALETGQESAETLVAVLQDMDHPSIGVNFDPANMLLYGMGEPVAALERLATWVKQVHVKDARRSSTAGEWGEEVPAGQGEVDWNAFFGVLKARDLDVDLVIEREAGDRRVADVVTARTLVEGLAR